MLCSVIVSSAAFLMGRSGGISGFVAGFAVIGIGGRLRFALLHPQAACRVVFLTFCRRWLLRLAELDAAGRLNTTKGQPVLNLAMSLATATLFDNLSQRAAATREIRASLDAALAGARPAADRLDELEQRRREKAAQAGL